jgi:Ca2+-binding RTX toxin-like protein
MSGVGMNGTSISNFEQFDLTGFAGSASITGANTADYIIGGGGNDQLVGVGGNDQMMGGAGNDKLLGGAGNDYLMGGVGRDRMVGGKGKDRFAFANAKDGMDIITDFNSPSDSIVISKQGFSANLGTKKLAKTQFVLGSKAQDKNDHFIYNSRSGVLSFDVDGIGGQKQIAIAKLSNHASMTAADIIFA